MKNLKLFLLGIAFFTFSKSYCQNVSMELCAGLGISNPTFKWAGTFKDKNAGNNFSEIGQLFSLGLTAKVHKFLYLKTEIGTNQTEHQLNVDYIFSDNGGSKVPLSINGTQRSDYFYLAVLPEIRSQAISNVSFYANFGAAFYANTSSYLFDVLLNREIGQVFRRNGYAFVANLGLNLKCNDNLGLVMSVGYHNMKTTPRTFDNIPQIGFTQFNFKGGISYTLR